MTIQTLSVLFKKSVIKQCLFQCIEGAPVKNHAVDLKEHFVTLKTPHPPHST